MVARMVLCTRAFWPLRAPPVVSIRARPALRPGDTVRVYYDGQPRIVSSMNFELNNVWRYRSGDYRILCQLQGDVFVVLVLEVGHRKNNYR